MRKSLLLVVLILIFIITGCATKHASPAINGKNEDYLTNQLVIPISDKTEQKEKTVNDIVDVYSEKQDLTKFIEYKDKKVDCSVNPNVDYMDVDIEIFNKSDCENNPTSIWYPNLNEGKIRHIAWFAQNKGCSKVFKPLIYVNIFYGNNIIYHDKPTNIDLILPNTLDYIYPLDNSIGGNHQIQKVVNKKGDYLLQIIVFDGNNKRLVGGNQVILSLN